jgi:hypothetical protein
MKILGMEQDSQRNTTHQIRIEVRQMSAYSFGKIMSAEKSDLVTEKIKHLATSAEINVTFGLHDPEDQELFNQSDLLRGDGVIFNLFTPGDSDLITLWNEAVETGRQAIRELLGESSLFYSWKDAENAVLPPVIYETVRHTRLGQFVSGLFAMKEAKSVGFALFDNGVEQAIENDAAKCLPLILKVLLLAWDCGPNALFVWKQDTQRTGWTALHPQKSTAVH